MTIPGQQLVNPADFVICDLGKNQCEPCLRVNAIELGSLNLCEGDCHGFATMLGTGKHPDFPAYGHGFTARSTVLLSDMQISGLRFLPLFSQSHVQQVSWDRGIGV